MRISTASGEWLVRRRWAPRRLGAQTLWARARQRFRRVFKRTSEAADIPDGCLADCAEGLAAALIAVIIVLLVVFVGIPLLVALVEFLLLVLLAAAGVVGRVLFRRPWTVDAVSADGGHHVWRVVGWRASGRAARFIAERIGATGQPPSPTEVEVAARLP